MIVPPQPILPGSRASQSILAFLLGALTVPGFAPFYLFPLPLATLGLLILLWTRLSARSAALVGFAFGLGFFGVGVSWVYVSIHDFGGMPMPLAVAATALFCMFLALFPAAVGWLQARAAGAAAIRQLLLIPALWTLSEWVRGWIFTGFPWLALGYSQVPASPLSGFAPVLGVYGISLVMAASAGAFACAADRSQAPGRKARLAALSVAGLLWLGGFGLKHVGWTHPVGAPITVSLLQGNIPQEMKWRPEKARATLDAYLGMTLGSTGRLTILPETALPMFLDEVSPIYLEMLATHGRSEGGDVLVGVPEYVNRPGGGEYYNSVLSLGSSPSQIYRKVHLVPFGEYIPLKPLLGWVIQILHIPLSDFSRGDVEQAPLSVAGQKVAMAICYEDVFGEELIRQLPEATLLVNVSNDAWFGDSVAPRQHLQISQMRAMETGRYMLRATNTGITAIIDQHGQVVKRAPAFVVTRLDGRAQGFAGETPFVRWGNGAVLVLLAVLVLAGGVLARGRA